jgi:hypothetical protein
MLIQGPFFTSDPEDESNEESATRLPQRHSLSPVLPPTSASPETYEDNVLSSHGSIQSEPDAQTDAAAIPAAASVPASSSSSFSPRQDPLNLLYDAYSTFDPPEEFQPEFSSSPPSSSMSSHDPRHIVASPLAEQEERKGARRPFPTRRYSTAVAPTYGKESSPSPISPVPSAAATEGVPESSGKVAFGFRKYASVSCFFFVLVSFIGSDNVLFLKDLTIHYSHNRDGVPQQDPSSSRVSSTIAGEDLESIVRSSSVSPAQVHRHRPPSRLRPLWLVSRFFFLDVSIDTNLRQVFCFKSYVSKFSFNISATIPI